MHVAGGRYDLHTHSVVSDGTEAPEVLVHAAAAAGLAGVALTDHDSTGGWSTALAAAEEAGIELLPGMELSSRMGWASVHVLAYLVDPDDPGLVAETARIRSERARRAEAIVSAIAVDYELSWDDVLAQTTSGTTIGRPHIADALVARGLASDRSAAFAGILHWRGGYYRPHYAPHPVEAVRLVRAAGGVPVIAHPAASSRGIAVESILPDLVDAGLFGLEVEHRENTADGKRRLRELAARHSLVTTGSSDYHGTGKPNRLGENTTSRATVDAIRASAR
ncbi:MULTISPECIES: PHP domain-containing protein [unclassified Rathayibacter]|uniref:PHP domain-containing protein n=1 Tax=unclassified Rathayibacter TaxID=2609250 RepID=UPI00188A52DF|nr:MULTISPECIES: PHP domain-containing protein [unclassified Rathayibacter]MBF4462763.1 PHP domain-containing protein [Rathayibacter sp. VKM Ac-2879]MBF4504177.1 PHP domain-containing protein [Rathayibacter sp. VKM Ac-2878]